MDTENAGRVHDRKHERQDADQSMGCADRDLLNGVGHGDIPRCGMTEFQDPRCQSQQHLGQGDSGQQSTAPLDPGYSARHREPGIRQQQNQGDHSHGQMLMQPCPMMPDQTTQEILKRQCGDTEQGERSQVFNVCRPRILLRIDPGLAQHGDYECQDREHDSCKCPVDLGEINVGDAVTVRVDSAFGTAWSGTISRIDPRAAVIDDKVCFVADVEVDNADNRLRPGMQGTVRISTGFKSIGWLIFHRPYRWLMKNLVW